MGSIFQRHAMATAFGIAALILLLVIGFETGWGSRLRAPDPLTGPARGAPVEAKLLPSIVASAPEAAYPETGNRPLFVPTRRPSPAAVQAATMNKGQFVLQGVTIVGDLKIAMLKEKNGAKTYRVELGKEVNGITVSKIEPDRVTLKMGDDSEEVPLNVQRVGAAPAAPATAATAATAATPRTSAPMGPFGVTTTPPPATPSATPPQAPGTPRPASGPMPTQPVPGSGPVPAQGGGGPVPTPMPGGAPQPANAPSAATPNLTAEEILARRRARRTQQQQ